MKEEDVYKYLDCEIYNVEILSNGTKQVHIDGYIYQGETFQYVHAIGCYVPIEKASPENCFEAFENAKQYQSTLVKENIPMYFKNCLAIPFENLTVDTPEGKYINYPNRNLQKDF